MRLFIAVELSADVRRCFVQITEALRRNDRHGKWVPGASWVRAENLHATLKFLGEVPDPQLPALTDALRRVPTNGPLHLIPDRTELFPPRGPVRVIGVGFGGDAGRLNLLQQAIEGECEAIAYPRERRPFHGHVTLARIRSTRLGPDRFGVEQVMGPMLPGPLFEVAGFSLMQSHLKPAGPEYVRLAQFPLNPEP